MLIEFSVRNYRSFWETQTLSMAAGASGELQEENSFPPPAEGSPRLLRSAVVYGPNGSGKSNLIHALNFMKELVVSSSKESQEGDKIERNPFLLHSQGQSQSTELETFIIQDGIRYQYGFESTENRVVHEWLLAYPGNRAQRWFERSYNPETNKEEWYFGSKLAGPKKTWQDSTRPNALFLSTAVQLNSEQLKPVFNWFKKLVVIRHGELIDPDFTVASCEDKEKCNSILNFLKGADIPVERIEIKERKIDSLKFFSGLPEELKNYFMKNGPEDKSFKEVFFEHQLSDTGAPVSFPLREESDGTKKLFAYAAPWLDVLKSGRILIVDELDNSFHPHLVRYLLKLIHSSRDNEKNGQLIFTTHDTSILDSKILRRDQVWFTEKDKQQATDLYPLTDFHPRKKEALEKGYLQGRYGALPYIGEVKF